MKNFRFRYSSIKNVKLLQENILTSKLASIENEILKLAEEINRLNEQKIALKNSIVSKKNVKASEAQLIQKYEADINLNIKAAKNKILELEIAKKKILSELIQKSKEIKVFETLEENDKLEFFKQLDKIEQKFLDDLSNRNKTELKI